MLKSYSSVNLLCQQSGLTRDSCSYYRCCPHLVRCYRRRPARDLWPSPLRRGTSWRPGCPRLLPRSRSSSTALLCSDRVNMHTVPRVRRLAPASCASRVPGAQGRVPRRASLEPLARAYGAVERRCRRRHAFTAHLSCVAHHPRCPHTRLRLVHGRVLAPGAREAHAHGRRPRALPRAQWLVPVLGARVVTLTLTLTLP